MPTAAARVVIVISDLHLGGKAAGNGRGFRICTHETELAGFIGTLAAVQSPAIELVINGDVVDFLAEETGDPENRWSPFHFPERKALDRFNDIAARSAGVFQALAGFLAKPNHRLVILPGNHDLELNLPAVRRRLRQAVGAAGAADYEFIPHGEAYRAGDVLIEHGNRADDMNFADYHVMRHLCGLLSRCQAVEPKFEFDPPAGSKLVAEVMNGIKEKYGFIDLLKPEVEAASPVILALEPGRRSQLAAVAKMLASGKVRRAEQELVYESNISALEAAPAVPRAAHPEARRSPEDFLGDILQRTVGRRDFGRPPAAEPPAEGGLEEISALGKARSLWTLLKGKGGATPEDTEEWNRRLFDLRDALLAFQGPDSFDRTRETAKVYWDEAVVLGRSPIRHVVFGHTHLAKQVRLPKGGGYYFNSGTWADFLGLPREILDTSRKLLPLGKLEQFVHDLIGGNLSAYDIFHPTYVRFDQDGDGNSLAAALVDYQPGAFPL